MITEISQKQSKTDPLLYSKSRQQLLKDLPITEKKIMISGISTAVLKGGNGQPVLFLHGPGENALWWMRIVPHMVKSHTLIIPDLPGHAASRITDNSFEPQDIYTWLSELINHTCDEPPVLVGHVLGGAIAARYAIATNDILKRLVLVDSLGIGKFRPSLRFAFGLMRFMFLTTEKNYHRFLPQCLYDMEGLKKQMGAHWDHFIAYNLECSNDPDHKNATQKLMKKLGIPRISSNDLAGIRIPTTLIWGRHDRANQLKIAQEASRKFGWPLYVIEQTRDDPKLEQPERFVDILAEILASS